MKLKALYLTLLFCVVIGCVNCSASNSSGSSDSLDSSAVLETISNEDDNEPRGMLKAFGLKGKVKTLTIYIGDDETGGFVFAFDPQGNYYKFDNYNGEEVGFEVEDDAAYCSFGIDNWKITDIVLSVRWRGGTTYEITSYDDYNRPSSASIYFELIENELAKKDVPISYSGSDSKGNYTKIHIDTRGIKEPDEVWGLFDVINLKIEYWPEDATMDAMPKPLTESLAEDLIKKANVKQVSALSKDLKKAVDRVNDKNATLISYKEGNNMHDIAISIGEIEIDDNGDSASVEFYCPYISIDGNTDDGYRMPEDDMFIAKFVYESGGWKVDDISWDVIYAHFKYHPGTSYKKDIAKCK